MLSTLIFALSAVAVSAAPIQPRSTELLLPNATQTGVDAVWYKMNGNNGACGHSDSDSDKVVGLPLEFYTDLSSVSPYCGQYVVVTNPNNNVSVTARVADASTLNNTLSLSVASWEALKDDSLHLVNWRRANETEVALAKKVSSAPSPTNTYIAPSHSAPASKEWKSPSSSSSSVESYSSTPVQHSSSSAVHSSSTWTPSSSAVHSSSTWAPSSSSSEDEKKTYGSSKSSSEWVAPSSSSHVASSTSTWTPPSSSSVAQNQRQAAPSSSSYVEEKKTSSTKAWVAPTTTWAPKTTTTSQYVAPKTTTQAQSSGGGGGWSGQATFYNQGGNPGSCGSYASDSDYVVAVNAGQMNSGWCGRTVTISSGGRTISARVADTCPGCSHGSLDLSIAAFGALGSYDQGVLPISWHF